MSDQNALKKIRVRRPLVHCISNIVSANDCANLLLSVGASPMMAQAEEEMADIAAISSAAVLNTGTPDAARFRLCALRGALAEARRTPVVLDPVGIGASSWRREQIASVLSAFRPSIVRVNLSEALALLGSAARERGVDSDADVGGEAGNCARALARRLDAVVLLSGDTDFISDGERSLSVCGGSAMMTAVTGSGCMLSALCGAFAAVEPDALQAACMAARFWKNCASRAEKCASDRGPGSFRVALIDAAYQLSTEP